MNACRERLIRQLTDQLPAIRARLDISQDELASRVGISRQTVSLIETHKQSMTWVTFMAMLALFENNKESLSQLSLTGFFDSADFAACLTINRQEGKQNG
jgi:DNA-binding XRE family transcriptional regulator